MEVRWSEAAAEDLERICEWIDRDDPEAARRVARTIYEQCGRLRDFPSLGRASRRMAGRRELTFAPLPYIVRRRAGWDYRLGGVGEATRWTIVLVGYLLGVALPTPAARLTSGFVGLASPCWPNFAYHLTNLFAEWPIAKGNIVSVADRGTRVILGYSYKHGSDSLGGAASLKRRELLREFSPGDSIAISYDPLNPKKSKIRTPVPAGTNFIAP
jgi:toxin ParE1/3/4